MQNVGFNIENQETRMRNLLNLFLILTCFSCKSTKELSQSESLAELIIEVNDKEQLKSFSNKLQKYKQNPESVFKDGGYYYDTENIKNQAYRGPSEDIKNNPEWFLLIDNLSDGKYLWEFDWKQRMDDIKWSLDQMAERKKYSLPELPEILNENEKDAGALLGIINETLNKNGLTLINLYINSDSYVTALIDKKNLEKIIAKASESGNKITEYKKY